MGQRGHVRQPARAHQPLGDIGFEPIGGNDDELSRLAWCRRTARRHDRQRGQQTKGPRAALQAVSSFTAACRDPTSHVADLILSGGVRASLAVCFSFRHRASRASHITLAVQSGRRDPPAYTDLVRVLGIDYGLRRVGLALSDPTGTLASPWRMLERPASEIETVRLIAEEASRLAREDDGLEAIVVGWPRRLDGSPTGQTPIVEAFARALGDRVGVSVVLQDERLSSHEAESRLTERGHRDWRSRKKRLDAAAAAVILQDYLDHRPSLP
jgi:putative Holliday junction resolvase